MDAAILNVGTELLMGEVVNTNATYLSNQMKRFGINVYYQIVVGDNHDRLKHVLDILMKNVDLVLVTGGLGPTRDDMTKEAISDVFSRPLRQNPEAVEQMENIMKKYGRTISENNYRQTLFPEGSRILKNNMGSAPGFILEIGADSKTIICMPGPPHEMKAMFEAHLEKYFSEKSDSFLHSKIFRISGLGESAVETKLMDLIEGQQDPTIATYAKLGEVALRIATRQKDEAAAQKSMAPLVKEIRSRLEPYIFSEDDRDLNEIIIEVLKERKWRVSTVESCTGGLLASAFVDVPGASDVFEEGFITYSNQAKIRRVLVGGDLLRDRGAVSGEVAEAMARGLNEQTGSQVCLSVTGIAGPGGGTEAKPVGLVYAAFLINGDSTVEKYEIRGGRERIRQQTVKNILKKLHELLKRVD